MWCFLNISHDTDDVDEETSLYFTPCTSIFLPFLFQDVHMGCGGSLAQHG